MGYTVPGSQNNILNTIVEKSDFCNSCLESQQFEIDNVKHIHPYQEYPLTG